MAETRYIVRVDDEVVADVVGRADATRFFNRQREATLEEWTDGEYVRTIMESVDAPNLDHNLLRG